MLQKLVQYLLQKLPNSFKGWTREALEDYVMWQIERNQLVAAVDDHGNIRAIVIGWPTEEMQVELFRWQEPTQHGRYWYWDQIAGDNPLAVMAAFSEMFNLRSDACNLPAFGVRHGKVRQFKQALDLYKIGEKLYGN